jgi:thioredoxin reductase (NADPH)
VIGGGNSALEESIYLTSLVNKVYLVHRRNEFRGDALIGDEVRKNDKIKILTPYIPLQIKGTSNVESVELKNLNDDALIDIAVAGVFIYVGQKSNYEFIKIDELKLNSGFIEVDENGQTNIEGLFACGDVIAKKLRQIVNACGEGANASMACINFLKK